MVTYLFARVPVRFSAQGTVDPASYERAITEHASQGWRLVQLFVENPAAIPSEYVLVFERVVEG